MLPGPTEWFIILLVVVIIFGGKKIPELMGGLGKGIKSFKKGLNSPDAEDPISNERIAEKTSATNKKPGEETD
jgi:sec-independent protein translocase protein TatA